MRKLITYTLGFMVFVILQIFVLSHVTLNQYLNVYIYIMIVIVADMQIKGYALLLLAFSFGMIADAIEGSPGLFAMTMTFMAFCRPLVLKWVASREISDKGGAPISSRLGNVKFFTYVIAMVSLWAIPFFIFESSGVANVLATILRIVLSVVVTTILIYFLQLPLNRNRYDT